MTRRIGYAKNRSLERTSAPARVLEWKTGFEVHVGLLTPDQLNVSLALSRLANSTKRRDVRHASAALSYVCCTENSFPLSVPCTPPLPRSQNFSNQTTPSMDDRKPPRRAWP
ncbi:unnamed protein product [Pieris macdunnoughi]|uniref:Uncharacterized protein n=1 Tax=Pieris macdunnoughi TaxID=345717 RepID=A0A821NZ68_9NEOP|nr:unnamed protein product [Pieris macdunnoughi]